MSTLTCKDLGFKCPFEVREETIHGVLRKIVDHIEDNHLEEWGKIEKNLDLEEEKKFIVRRIKNDNRTPV